MQKILYGLFSRLVYGLSLIFSAYLLYLSVWHVWNGETLDWRLILLLSGVAGALLFGLCRFLQGHEKLADRLWKLCIYIGVPLYTAGLIWYSARMTIIPQYDLNEVQAEALRLAAGGTGAWSSYFMTFPHQIPVTLILAAAYRLGMAVGVNDFYMAGNAANALALGLSELIQQQTGGIQIEALFIDEGFGSLDPQALQKALSALLAIQDSRMIGVISHISELKEQIADQLVVTNTAGKSTISYRSASQV